MRDERVLEKHEKHEKQDCYILEKYFLGKMKLELVCISAVAGYGDNDDGWH